MKGIRRKNHCVFVFNERYKRGFDFFIQDMVVGLVVWLSGSVFA
jgi:hypothetical protein